MEKAEEPLPAAVMTPWLADNETYQQELQLRDSLLQDLSPIRARIETDPGIRMAEDVERCTLGAVDAASVAASFGDQVSILVQMVHVADDGTPIIGSPQRVTGIDSQEMHMATAPIRVAIECEELAKATSPTIADTSYWSFLMEVNLAITQHAHNPGFKPLEDNVRKLVNNGALLAMLQNPCIVPMSKKSQSDTYLPGVSDRQVLGRILLPGEFLCAQHLTITGSFGAANAITDRFGIERRVLKPEQIELIRYLYRNKLGFVFYKPHPWTRAFRIEGHLDRLRDDAWLMPLLAAIKVHTAVVREIIEPWPQFMADYIAKQISGVAKLYGEANWHRWPNSNYVNYRTQT